MKFFKKNFVKRALRTFFQTAIGYITVNITLVDFSNDKSILKSTLMGILISAISAGIAAIMNLKGDNVNE